VCEGAGAGAGGAGGGATVWVGDGGGAAGADEDGGAVVGLLLLLPAAAAGCRAGRCFRFLWAATRLGLGLGLELGVACAVGRTTGLTAVVVWAPAARANRVAKATAVIALSCVARQVRRDRRRRPSSRAAPGVWVPLMGLTPPEKTLRANQEPLKGPLPVLRVIGLFERVTRRFSLRAVKQ